MKRVITSLLAVAFVLGIPTVGTAHHPPKMERCMSISFSGRIAEIQWRPPHVELFIEMDDGMVYQVSWLAINQLHLAGIDRDTLQVGDDVAIVAGFRPNEVTDRPMLLSYIHRERDDWGWSQTPQGC